MRKTNTLSSVRQLCLPDDDIVKHARDVTDKAKNGEIVAIATIVIFRDGSQGGGFVVKDAHRCKMIGAVDYIKYRMLKRYDELD